MLYGLAAAWQLAAALFSGPVSRAPEMFEGAGRDRSAYAVTAGVPGDRPGELREVSRVLEGVLLAGRKREGNGLPEDLKDLETRHWAFQAVSHLKKVEIVEGYPDGFFRGKRAITRYEMSKAFDRAMSRHPFRPGP
jgi:hypothetical protein